MDNVLLFVVEVGFQCGRYAEEVLRDGVRIHAVSEVRKQHCGDI